MLRRQVVTVMASAIAMVGNIAAPAPAASQALAPHSDGLAEDERRGVSEPRAIEVGSTATWFASAWLDRLRHGAIDRALLDPEVSARLSEATIVAGESALVRLGPPLGMVAFATQTTAAGTTRSFRVRFPEATLTWIVSQNPQGRVNGLTLRPRRGRAIFRAVVGDGQAF